MAIPLKTEKNVEYVAQGSLLQKRFEFAHVLVISPLASDFERDFLHAVKQTLHRQIFGENSKNLESLKIFSKISENLLENSRQKITVQWVFP